MSSCRQGSGAVIALAVFFTFVISACGDDSGGGGIDEGLFPVDMTPTPTTTTPPATPPVTPTPTDTGTGDGDGDASGDGDGDTGGDGDASGDGDGDADPCASVSNPCTTAGASCSGNTLTECAADANDCLVETTTNCTRGSTDVCDPDASGGAACVAVDPCEGVANACTTAGTACDGDDLVTCAANTDSCLVETTATCEFGCNSTGTDACNTDPCEGLTLCTTAGVTCSGAFVVTCADNGSGCLVETEQNCTAVTDMNWCDPAGGAKCVDDDCRDADGNQKLNVCETAGTSCDGDLLTTCADDGEGCLIATNTNCTTDGDNNWCNPAEPAKCDMDPCLDYTSCETGGVLRCEGNQIILCDPLDDVNTCTVEKVDTTCALNLTCCTPGDTACSGETDPTCQACVHDEGCTDDDVDASTCSSNDLVTCTDTDGDGCLNKVTQPCGTDYTCDESVVDQAFCDYTATDTCDDNKVALLGLNVTSAQYGNALASDGADDYANYDCADAGGDLPAEGNDVLFALDLPSATRVRVSLTGVAGFQPWIVLLDGCGSDGCLDLGTTSVSINNEDSGVRRVYVVVDADSGEGTFALEVETIDVVCGDGFVDTGETCDDGNTDTGDGCDDACLLETGGATEWFCTQSAPTVCTTQPNDGKCGGLDCPAPLLTEFICCTPDDACGYGSTFTGNFCFSIEQDGVTDASCPSVPGVGLSLPALAGCCRPDGQCGLESGTSAGCIENTETWKGTLESSSATNYPGPFRAQTCTYPTP